MAVPKWRAEAWFYYTAMVAGGVLVLARVLSQPASLADPNLYWPLLVIPMLVLHNTYIQLPNCDGRICPSGIFVLHAAVVWGPGPAALLAVVEALTNAFKQSADRFWRLLFNVAALSMAIFFATTVAEWFLPRGPADSVASLFSRSMLIALLYYTLNMGAVLGMMSLVQGGLNSNVRSALLWSWASYAVAGVSSGALGLLRGQEVIAIIVGAVILFLTVKTMKHYFGVLKLREELLGKLKATHHATLKTLATAIEAKDPVTHGHVLRVQKLSESLARALGVGPEMLESVTIAALLHDIGKLAVPEYVLYECDDRDPDEQRKVRSHALLGAEILEHSLLGDDVKSFVKHHHERFDGQGYPHGLKGTEIPYGARILAVANMYDKLRHPRNGEEKPVDLALQSLEEESGRGLDPDVVACFCQMIRTCEPVGKERRADDSGTEGALEAELDNLSFVEDVHLSHKETRTLFTLARNIRSTNELSRILDYLLEAIQEFIPCTAARVFLTSRSTHEPELVHAVGMPDMDATSWPNQRWFARLRQWLDRGLEYVEQRNIDNTFAGEDGTSERQAIHTMAMFPIVLNGPDRGMILLCHHQPFSYSEDDRQIVTRMIEHAAASIATAREYEQFQKESVTDALTGLANGRMLRQQGPVLISNTLEEGRTGCVVMLDLNGFKQVNDTLGHHEGDRLLVNVSKLLKEHFRGGDLVARNGGDEFVVVLAGMDPSVLLPRLGKLHEAACRLWPAECRATAAGISCGCAWFPADGTTLAELMKEADVRMYADKRAKKAARERLESDAG